MLLLKNNECFGLDPLSLGVEWRAYGGTHVHNPDNAP